jgi:Zn-dependent protease
MSYYDWNDTNTRTRAPKGAFRTSPVFIGIVVLFVASAYLAWTGKGNPGVDVFLFVVSGWLLSLCLHEFAHAFTAYQFGDRSVAQRGYLQLDPFKYTHWVMSILIPLVFLLMGGFPLPGGAVYIDHTNIRGPARHSTVSLVGPATNFVFAALSIAPFALGADLESHQVFWSALAYFASIQLVVAVLNILPVPGLDGGNAIYPWLKGEWRSAFDAVRPYGFFIIMLLVLSPSVGNAIFGPLHSWLYNLGVPQNAIYDGQELFRFWRSPLLGPF